MEQLGAFAVWLGWPDTIYMNSSFSVEDDDLHTVSTISPFSRLHLNTSSD